MKDKIVVYIEVVIFLILTPVTAAVNLSLVVFLSRYHRAHDDIVSMVMLSLAVIDTGFGAIIPTSVAIIDVVRLASPHVVLPQALAMCQGSLYIAGIHASEWHLAAMSALKCYNIVRPLQTAEGIWSSTRPRNALIVILWTSGWAPVLAANAAGLRWAFFDPAIGLAVMSPDSETAITGLRYYHTILLATTSTAIVAANIKIITVVRIHHIAIAITNSPAASSPVASSSPVFVSSVSVIKTARDADDHRGGQHLSSPASAVIGAPARSKQRFRKSPFSWSTTVRSARSLFVLCIAYYVICLPLFVNSWVDTTTLPVWYRVGSRTLFFCGPLLNSLLYITLYTTSTRRDYIRTMLPHVVVEGCIRLGTNAASDCSPAKKSRRWRQERHNRRRRRIGLVRVRSVNRCSGAVTDARAGRETSRNVSSRHRQRINDIGWRRLALTSVWVPV